ncbi:DUF4835 family protein [Halosquirtibacter xylanolyticus]|uniref:type IX secretion system protein PorD n=1 Tax=Halosquirtibacter xylanolyticus TaxID=3374599 RepID=UPI003748D86B|nr:DUF4835 family protein [Prolixibacteraceae bacterium]
MMRKYWLCISLFLMVQMMAISQELRCSVSVTGSGVEGVNPEVFSEMQKQISEFINNTRWSQDRYRMEERIVCNMTIQITSQYSDDGYRGTIQVQSRRPAFNSSYESTMLNLKDKDFDVRFDQYKQIEFSQNSSGDNLSNILAYYVYIVLGFDYDTFSPMGGQPYFEKASEIVNRSQNIQMKGWKSFENDYNRYWLVNNVMNSSYSDFRTLVYEYYRNGLDLMSDKLEMGQENIVESLKNLQKVNRARSGLYIVRVFCDAHRNEIVSILQGMTSSKKNTAFQIMMECDPSNSAVYEKAMQTQ